MPGDRRRRVLQVLFVCGAVVTAAIGLFGGIEIDKWMQGVKPGEKHDVSRVIVRGVGLIVLVLFLIVSAFVADRFSD
jgi:hypothetical protein